MLKGEIRDSILEEYDELQELIYKLALSDMDAEKRASLTKRYHAALLDSREKHFSALAAEYQDAINVIQSGFDMLSDSTQVVEAVIEQRRQGDEAGKEVAATVIDDLVEAFDLGAEFKRRVTDFLDTFPGQHQLIIAVAIRTAYVTDGVLLKLHRVRVTETGALEKY